jgi:HK97 family phage major capsid protein
MNTQKYLKEQRGQKVKDLQALHATVDGRAYTTEERSRDDALAAEIKAIDDDIAREARAQALLKPVTQLSAALGLTDKEIRSYSLTRAINAIATNKTLDGFEGECSQEERNRVGRNPGGFFIPFEVLAAGREERAQTVSPSSAGGYLVGQSIDRQNMVGLLRNQTHVLQLGARVITGLKDDVLIPRHTAGVTAYWVSETGEISESNETFGQIAMKPRRLGAVAGYSKQLLAQGSPDIDAFVKEDILAKFGIEIDRAAINGAGANEPLGILGLATADRATSVTFGAAPTWAKVVDFETQVETANALGLPGGAYAYLTTPGVRGAWKTKPKEAGQATYIWENGDMVNGYMARSTNQVPSNKVIFGQFGQVVIGEWAGTDIVVDPYTLASSGKVKVTIQKLMDIVIRQGKSFSVSTDAGNQ